MSLCSCVWMAGRASPGRCHRTRGLARAEELTSIAVDGLHALRQGDDRRRAVHMVFHTESFGLALPRYAQRDVLALVSGLQGAVGTCSADEGRQGPGLHNKYITNSYYALVYCRDSAVAWVGGAVRVSTAVMPPASTSYTARVLKWSTIAGPTRCRRGCRRDGRRRLYPDHVEVYYKKSMERIRGMPASHNRVPGAYPGGSGTAHLPSGVRRDVRLEGRLHLRRRLSCRSTDRLAARRP